MAERTFAACDCTLESDPINVTIGGNIELPSGRITWKGEMDQVLVRETIKSIFGMFLANSHLRALPVCS